MPSPAHFHSTQLAKRKQQPILEDAPPLMHREPFRFKFEFRPNWRNWLEKIKPNPTPAAEP